jgi:hypothetical protein
MRPHSHELGWLVEIFSCSVKSLFVASPADAMGFDRVLGLTLESCSSVIRAGRTQKDSPFGSSTRAGRSQAQ